MNNLERSWMYERLDGRGGLFSRFVTEVDEFIQFTCSQSNRMSGDKVRCPCAKYQNYKFMDVETVKCHLYQSGFIENYFIWKHQWERDDISETSYAGPNFSQGSSWQSYSNSEPESSHPFQYSMEEDPNPISKKFYDLLDVANAKLYLGSSLSQLTVVFRMLNIKMENNMSQRGYNQMMQLLKESLPKDNIVLDNYYQMKKLVCSLGLPVEKIDCCESGCMLHYGDDDEHLTSCKFCSKPRYKHCVGSRKRKLLPDKRTYYSSLIPRLQRLYASHTTAADMRWHHEHKKENGVMHHPSDSEAWKHFNESHPFFAAELRNVRLGLCTDGFQPFSQSGRKYSSWPVIFTPYNLPPEMCMKEAYMFLTIIVPGPSNPKHKIDVYLQPLIKELTLLWEIGVEAFVISKRQNFQLRAALMWTISDFPTYYRVLQYNPQSRLDTAKYCDRPQLGKDSNVQYPKAVYTLDKEARVILFSWVKCLKFSDGDLTSTTLRVDDMVRLKRDIPQILCKLERIFTHGFFNSMEHLPVHLPYEARVVGPMQYRWMYPFERYLGTLKKMIRNKASVEGSISEAYLMMESTQLFSYYFEPHVMSRNHNVDRNDDGGVVEDLKGNLSIFSHPGRLWGEAKKRDLILDEIKAAQTYILLNCEEVEPFVSMYLQRLEEEFPNLSQREIDESLEENFAIWFKGYARDMTRGGYRAGKSTCRSKAANRAKIPSIPAPVIKQDDTSSISTMPPDQTPVIPETSPLLKPSSKCSSSITLSFKSEVDPNRINWKGVSQDVKDGYFGEFKYEINSKNHYGGHEVAAGTHTGGSITAGEHQKKLALKIGRDPTPSELHLHVHTNNHDGKSFVGQRSRLLHERYEEII
ncbi:hypothetical protein P3S68_001377 [Capsicum galapagoense]